MTHLSLNPLLSNPWAHARAHVICCSCIGSYRNHESNCIAVVAHFEYTGEWQHNADEMNWAYKDCIGRSDEEIEALKCKHGLYVISPTVLEEEGIYLEQFLCYVNRATPPKGSSDGVPPTFYVIFTFREPKGSMKHTLRDWQYEAGKTILKDGGEKLSLRKILESHVDLIDQDGLTALAKRVVHHFTEPYTRLSRNRGGGLSDLPTCAQTLSASCEIVTNSVSAFDFSARECLQEPYVEVKRGLAAAEDEPLPQLILPVGDALQEPFWPEGLGVNRGIHNALDACWVANKWAMALPKERKDVLKERKHLYSSYTMLLSGNQQSMLKPGAVYHADPASRYRSFQDITLQDFANQARALIDDLAADEKSA